MLEDIDYKNISFSRPDGISVNYKAIIINPSNLNEDFLILKGEGITSSIESRLFYWIDNKRWTLNEFIFFALNNSLCIKISDKDNNELASYGVCEIINRVFGHKFGINFN